VASHPVSFTSGPDAIVPADIAGSPAICAGRPSFQLTRAADYAVRAVLHLATLRRSQSLTQRRLAQAVGVPPAFLAKVLQRLAAGGFVASERGAQGGFRITPEGRAASLLDVVQAIDGPLLLNVCLAEGRPCSRAEWCPAHLVWREAERRLTAVLGRARISRLAAAERARRSPLESDR